MAREHGNYNYDASVPAAALFVALFGLTLGLHLFQAIRRRCRYLIPLLVATTLETLGYVFRIIAIKQPDTLWPLIVSETFIIPAPAFLAANEYMIFGRIMAYVGSEHGLVGHEWITKIFVASDVVAILTQVTGGSMLSGNGGISTIKLGRTILIVGLVLQVVSFGIFMFIALAFDIKTRRSLGDKMEVVRPLIWAFYVSAALIITRSIYRTVEFSTINFEFEEQQGYAITHEWLFYVFDSLLIIVATVVFNLIHPSNYLPNKKGLRMDGTTFEIKKRRWFNNKSPPATEEPMYELPQHRSS